MKSFNPFGPSLGNSLGEAADTPIRPMTDLLPSKTTPSKTSTSNAKSDDAEAKRRGPNSHRVRNMFDSITEKRSLLDDVIKEHNVSVHVARQSKRFDPFMDRGQVVIKTLADNDGDKKTFIWRVPNAK